MYKLILIDDEQRIVEGMGQLFPWESVGFEIAGTFTSAAAALEFLRNEHVVLSDIQMPNMTGIDLCKALQQEEGVRVFLFSSYQNYEYFRSAIQYNVADYAEGRFCVTTVQSGRDLPRRAASAWCFPPADNRRR